MGNLNQFFRDLGRNAYGLGENVASLGSAAIAEPVAGFAAMYDPTNGAQAIREGMTYQPRTQAGQMYQQGAARTLGTIAQPAIPVIDTWQRGVDIAGGYSPMAGAMLRTVPAAIGVAMGAKPALQAGRQASESLGAMQARMIANANAPKTLNAGYMGQRGAIGSQRPLTEFEQAHLTAQRNAALPVEKGGLGLAPDNTAMDRARAMGFDVDTNLLHGTSSDFGEFSDGRIKTYLTNKPEIAEIYANARSRDSSVRNKNAEPNIIPVITRNNNELIVTDVRDGNHGWSSDNLRNALGTDQKRGLYDIAQKQGIDRVRIDDMLDLGGEQSQWVVADPSNIRSRFAAFDPFNRDSSNLLAQSAKFAPAATLGALMANEKRKDKRN